jgi:hypothetical protein
MFWLFWRQDLTFAQVGLDRDPPIVRYHRSTLPGPAFSLRWGSRKLCFVFGLAGLEWAILLISASQVARITDMSPYCQLFYFILFYFILFYFILVGLEFELRALPLPSRHSYLLGKTSIIFYFLIWLQVTWVHSVCVNSWSYACVICALFYMTISPQQKVQNEKNIYCQVLGEIQRKIASQGCPWGLVF